MIPLERLTLNPPSKLSWFDIPYKFREIIIDKMDAVTRCLFSRCSKICNDEANKSKFYIYGLSVTYGSMYGSSYRRLLEVMYDESGNGYRLEFINGKTSQTIVVCKCLKAGKMEAYLDNS
ncbi:unnamed protein product [Caenorhabditis angaria]|uniref:F-box domain-containing protein n=1 Tax=Caenorhabditis angaria TaxID=860376 RepID=A0A9P1MXD5_9PELO|nr:unnamed protein product [Caenorhabditis angaria]